MGSPQSAGWWGSPLPWTLTFYQGRRSFRVKCLCQFFLSPRKKVPLVFVLCCLAVVFFFFFFLFFFFFSSCRDIFSSRACNSRRKAKLPSRPPADSFFQYLFQVHEESCSLSPQSVGPSIAFPTGAKWGFLTQYFQLIEITLFLFFLFSLFYFLSFPTGRLGSWPFSRRFRGIEATRSIAPTTMVPPRPPPVAPQKDLLIIRV